MDKIVEELVRLYSHEGQWVVGFGVGQHAHIMTYSSQEAATTFATAVRNVLLLAMTLQKTIKDMEREAAVPDVVSKTWRDREPML